jgi:hypothetical protein
MQKELAQMVENLPSKHEALSLEALMPPKQTK